MLTVRTAPTAARKLTKSTGFVRQSLAKASKAEEQGTPGAREAREQITANFQAEIKAAEAAVDETRRAADDLDDLALGLEHPCTTTHPKARAAHLLGVPAAPIAAKAVKVTERLRDAADRAEARLDAADADLKATATHALFLA